MAAGFFATWDAGVAAWIGFIFLAAYGSAFSGRVFAVVMILCFLARGAFFYLYGKSREALEFGQGVILAMCVVLLLSAPCWGLIGFYN
jgi:hypothetical protein